jgi:hypothetical protein
MQAEYAYACGGKKERKKVKLPFARNSDGNSLLQVSTPGFPYWLPRITFIVNDCQAINNLRLSSPRIQPL